jgi:hypothetical protein
MLSMSAKKTKRGQYTRNDERTDNQSVGER